MSAMSIHISAEDFKERPPVEPNIYEAVIGKAVRNEATQEGKFDYYAVPFSFEDSEGGPRILTRNFSLSPKAKGFIAQLLKAVGTTPEGDEGVDFECDDLEGERVKIAVTQRKWKDDTGEEHIGNDIKKVLPLK